ncbi:ankyrin repeat-containing domain protein [Sparassis latifolia]
MPVPTRVQPEKNIWVAAGDGDLGRVRRLTLCIALSPNLPDPYTYTPMHAAASYGQIHVLEYLISQGGDVNVTDSDGDTPLYVVENIMTAWFLVENGATVDHRNNEGASPAETLAEDFEEVATYLNRVSSAGDNAAPPQAVPAQAFNQPSQHAQNIASETLTSLLMQSVQEIMQRAEEDGHDPEEELRQAVGRTVLEGVVTGYGMTTEGGEERRDAGRDGMNGAKRSRTDGPG